MIGASPFPEVAVISFTLRCLLLSVMAAPQTQPASQPAPATGYAGFWEEVSGRSILCSAGHGPRAHYAEAVGKTFFVYNGTSDLENGPDRRLEIMIGWFDHRDGVVCRPTRIAGLRADPRQSPALALDDKGQILVWVPASQAEPGWLFVSTKPYDIGRFEEVGRVKFQRLQPLYPAKQGFVLLRDGHVPGVFLDRSADGRNWPDRGRPVVTIEGASFISRMHGGKTAIALSSPLSGPASVTNLFYLESQDGGTTWSDAQGASIKLPLGPGDVNARVFDYASVGQRVWLKDLQFDAAGKPVILYVLARADRGAETAPARASSPGSSARPATRTPIIWTTAHWAGRSWQITGLITSDHPCDAGCLQVDGREWRLLAPTLPGPKPGPGGDVALWTTIDGGRSWEMRTCTQGERYNHNHVYRPVNARPECAAFWSDADIAAPSQSRLYFADQEGRVFRLPLQMTAETARPELLARPATRTRPVPASHPSTSRARAGRPSRSQ